MGSQILWMSFFLSTPSFNVSVSIWCSSPLPRSYQSLASCWASLQGAGKRKPRPVEHVCPEFLSSKRIDQRSVMQNPFLCCKSEITRNVSFSAKHCCHAGVQDLGDLHWNTNGTPGWAILSFPLCLLSIYCLPKSGRSLFLKGAVSLLFWLLVSFFRLFTSKYQCLWFSGELNSWVQSFPS